MRISDKTWENRKKLKISVASKKVPVAYMMTNHKRKKGREATRDVNNGLTKTSMFRISLAAK